MVLLATFLRRFGRPVRVAIQVSVLAIILLSLGTVGFVEYSAQPGFCDNCHIMEPYYQSWETSSHGDVPCIQCHYAPGIKAEAMGKLQAANQVVKYITGSYGMKPWAEIEDAACLRSGCHSLRRVEGAVDYNGILFDHATHLGELRRGKQLRCTSCHSQIVQGDHVRVTESTCYLCHFKGLEEGDPVAGCVSCHASPPRFTSPAGFVVDHPQYVEDLVSCVSCHEKVTSGSGEADRSRCFACHNEPERLNEFENTTLVHRVHIAEHNVECTQCHIPIQHRVVSIQPTFELDCGTCHGRVHDEQQRMYAGLGGHGADANPSAMFQANVSCRGCHDLLAETAAHAEVRVAAEATCMSCHGVRYANILPGWQSEVDRRLRIVDAVVRDGERALASAPVRRRAAADSVLRQARENVDFVRRGKGAHNITYADRLLRASVQLVREAVTAGRLAYTVPDVDLGPAISENVCLQCHLGIEGREVPFGARSFDHEPHIREAGLSCGTCHTSLANHGSTLLSSEASCEACHHVRISPMNCARCHAGPGGAPEAPLGLPGGDFSHSIHQTAGLACAACHTPPSMDASALRCESCHEPHHQPEARCLDCHRAGAQDKHTRATAHVACATCHGDRAAAITEWTRQVCTACHVSRVDHFAPTACQDCHQVPAMTKPEGAP